MSHSRSPAIHRTALSVCGLEGSYEAIKADRTILEATCQRIRDRELTGINVTMPLKGDAAELADFLTPEAAKSGSVNTLRLGQEGLEGHSTDVIALRRHLSNHDSSTVLVLGAGGAARAVLEAAGHRLVYVAARDQEKALSLCQGRQNAEVIRLGTPVAGAVVVNATPLGMAGESLPEGVVEACSALIDLAYGLEETPAIAVARLMGIPFADGLEFLVGQAVESFEWWTGLRPPLQPLLEAARKG